MTNESTTVAPFNFDAANMEEQIAYGSGRIYVRFNVVGYWSDVVNLRFNRSFNYCRDADEAKCEWIAEVSHSSGGRDPEQIESDVLAERNFAAAVIAACDLADILTARLDEIEAAYKQREAIYAAERERERAEMKAKLDADPGIGDAAARAYVNALMANTRVPTGPRKRELSARVRGHGEDFRYRLVAERGWDGKVRLSFNGSVVSRKDAISNIAGLAFKDLRPDEVKAD